MTEPTDRERVAWALCGASDTGPCICARSARTTCASFKLLADAAIALGAKPPVDPFQTLMGEVMEVWARNCTIQHVTTQDVTAMEMVVRHVVARAKEMGL